MSVTNQAQRETFPAAAAARLWLGPAGPQPQTRFLRRTFDLNDVPAAAALRLFAEARYHVWVNGAYVGRGPTFHHPMRLPYDTYDVAAHLRPGRNVVAALVHAPAVAYHNHIPSGEPGLVADLSLGDGEVIVSDERWRVTDRTGWRDDTPRRNWAIDYVECVDAAVAPRDWQSPDFDDHAWATPEVHRPATAIGSFVVRPQPPLRYARVAPRLVGVYRITEPARPLTEYAGSGAYGNSIMRAAWEPDPAIRADGSPDRLPVRGLTPDAGAVLWFDLGAEYGGQVTFDADCPTGGVIDVGWSEVVRDGRPQVVMKGVGYVDRLLATAGTCRWEPIQFSAMRHLVLVLRGFDGPVTLRNVGVRSSEPDIKWAVSFRGSDPRLNEIFDLCVRTQRVGTQEGMMDCPTREQAPYVGDGMLTSRWFAQLTGDASHWRYLVREQFRRQASSGLLRSSIFSGSCDTLIDYSLLGVIGTRDYYWFTRDPETVAEVIDGCRRVIAYFDRLRATDGPDEGLVVTNWQAERRPRPWEQRYDPSEPQMEGAEQTNLFIDHPGMGWHNIGEAGIDRRGTNAAINALLVLARRALADLEDVAGDAGRAAAARSDADVLAVRVRERFWDARRRAFVDGVHEGRPLQQVSEQTNTWAVAAGCCDEATARDVLRRLLTSDDPAIAHNGPYFWSYLLPELDRLGLHRLALDRITARWGRMLDGGATTLWETFSGDDKDSWCHPWSGAPLEFLLTAVVGLPGVGHDESNPTLRPRYDLLEHADGSIHTRGGSYRVVWITSGDSVRLSGHVPPDVEARVVDPMGTVIGTARGDWQIVAQR